MFIGSLFLMFLALEPLTSGFYRFPSKMINRKDFLIMGSYKYAKEYFEYYREHKGGLIQGQPSSNEFYDDFAKKRENNYKLYEKNVEKIAEANSLLQQMNKTFTLSTNQYADIIDLDDPNKQDLMTNPVLDNRFRPATYLKVFQTPFPYIETIINQNKKMTYNWNDTGLLSPVKNQGQCGSCWAFSVTSSLETFMRINGYNVDRLSEQELVDCSTENYGCNGGLMHLAFEYIINEGGLSNNRDYPYKALDQNCSCHLPYTNSSCTIPKAIGSKLHDYQFVIPKSVLDMKLNVIKTPITLAIDADNVFFRFYKSGVIDLPANYSKSMNHAVLLVGFDYDDDGMYWIIQNSWGKKWGDNGFCRVRVRPDAGVLSCQQYGVYPVEIKK